MIEVCKVKCKINDLPLHFVFDTDASDVTLSIVEATFMTLLQAVKQNGIRTAMQHTHTQLTDLINSSFIVSSFHQHHNG